MSPFIIEVRPVSQSVVSNEAQAAGQDVAAALNELNFRPVPFLAPVSLVFGLAAVCGLASIPLLSIGLTGLILGVITLIRIKRSDGVYSGGKIALAGTLLSFLFLSSGASLHAYNYATEVPEGYERKSFYALAKMKPIVEKGATRIRPEVIEEWDNKKVYVKGYMYPTGVLHGLKTFVLCKDTGQCCFGGNPLIEDMIVVNMTGDKTIDHRELLLVGIGGTFHAKKIFKNGVLTHLYSIDADFSR